MKWIGIFLIIGATTTFGFQKSRSYANRVKEIRQLLQSLQMIEAEMGYSHLPLQQVFLNISHYLHNPIKQFYSNIASRLQNSNDHFPTIWCEEIKQLKNISAMKKNEIHILEQFGLQLGQYNFHEQEKHIRLTVHHLQSIQKEADDDRYQHERLARVLGFLTGLFIILIIY